MELTSRAKNRNIPPMKRRRRQRRTTTATTTSAKFPIIILLLSTQIRIIFSFIDVSLQQQHPLYNIPHQKRTTITTIIHGTNNNNLDSANNNILFKNKNSFVDEIQEDHSNVIRKKNGVEKNGYTITDRASTTSTTKSSKSLLWSKKHTATFSNNQKLWSRRHAKSIEEGIRREQKSTNLLHSVLEGSLMYNHEDIMHNSSSENKNKKRKLKKKKKRRYGARTIAALIVALAEEAQGLEVEVDAREDTYFWDKQVDMIRINFSRLGVQALQLSGLDQAIHETLDDLPSSTEEYILSPTPQEFKPRKNNTSTSITAADDIFTRIDTDNSGELDEDELVGALMLAMDPNADVSTSNNTTSTTSTPPTNKNTNKNNRRNISKEVLKTLAAQLMRLYDVNDSKGIDRTEYQSMVDDMAALRRTQRVKALKKQFSKEHHRRRQKGNLVSRLMRTLVVRLFGKSLLDPIDLDGTTASTNTASRDVVENDNKDSNSEISSGPNSIVDITNKPILAGEGSIVLTDLKLDLRRLLFGAVPWVKKVTPGGPLILQPFTMTATGSFTREDLLNSGLLNTGLRLLVARALRRRVTSVRDLFDGAVFYGRTWNLASDHAPNVEVPILTNIEFDAQDRVIISGRAQVRASPDAPYIENAFKLRTRIATRLDGRVIRLKDPELALVVECPESWERGIVGACRKLNLPIPPRPKPVNTYIPLVSPLKVNSNKDGYYLGEDNFIQSIDIKDGTLQFEMSAVIRPGRFLDNHYIAFTVPQRTFICTMDRMKNLIRVARRNKMNRKKLEQQQLLQRINQMDHNHNNNEHNTSSANKNGRTAIPHLPEDENRFKQETNSNFDIRKTITPTKNPDGFISKFVQGYMLHAMTEEIREEDKYSRFASAVSEWFGGQQHNEDEGGDSVIEEEEDD